MKLHSVLLCAAVATLLFACQNRHKEVVSVYPNGQNELVYQMDGAKDQPQCVGEKKYYEDGQLRWEKQFKDNAPTGTWKYYYGNGQLFAQGEFSAQHPRGNKWIINTADGRALHTTACDSVVVTAFTPDMFPTTIGYYSGDTIYAYEFYEDIALRGTGRLVNGERDGNWVFYFPNGIKQAEATYVNGVENGMHSVYRENGMPYYRVAYVDGKRSGTMEVYDAEGNLSGTQNYDK